MYKALYPRDDVHRLYLPRNEVGRKLANIEYGADSSIQRFEDYREKYGGRLNTATRNNTDNPNIKKPKITRKKWEEKQLYGHVKRQTNEISYL